MILLSARSAGPGVVRVHYHQQLLWSSEFTTIMEITAQGRGPTQSRGHREAASRLPQLEESLKLRTIMDVLHFCLKIPTLGFQ